MQLLSGVYFVHIYQRGAVYAVCVKDIITSEKQYRFFKKFYQRSAPLPPIALVSSS